MLEDHANILADGVEVHLGVREVEPVHHHVAAGDVLELVQAAQERGLPRAGGPDHADHLALGNVNVDPLQNLVGTEGLLQSGDVDLGAHLLNFLSRTLESCVSSVMTMK